MGNVFGKEQAPDAERLVMELSGNKPSVRQLRDTARLWARMGVSGVSRAIELQRQAVTSCPVDDNLLRASLNYDLGTYLLATGDARGAAECFEVAVRLQPSHEFALNNLAYLKAEELGDAAGAVPMAERLLQLAPKNALVLDTVGWVYFRNGDAERAKQHLTSSLTIQPSVDAYVHLAAVLASTGDKAGAEKQLQEAEKLDSSPETRQKIKAQRDDIGRSG
jgi:tetratricopeptide (TPR) repeat protein